MPHSQGSALRALAWNNSRFRVIRCPWPSPETSYCSVPYSSAHLCLHFHYRSCSERGGGSKASCLYTLLNSCLLFRGEEKILGLTSDFLHPPMCYNLGFARGEDRIGEVSDIFCGVRGEGTELVGTPTTLSQTGKQLCGAITAPAPAAQGTGIQPHRHLPIHCPASSSSFPSLLGSASPFPFPAASPWVAPCSTGRVTCRKSRILTALAIRWV